MATQRVLHVEIKTETCSENESYQFNLPIDTYPSRICEAAEVLYGPEDIIAIIIEVMDIEEDGE
jgi:hypothetical protein